MRGPTADTRQSDLPDIAAAVFERLRERSPRVHCLTNVVAQTFTANVLLAAGAVPSMTISPSEIAGFVARADALLINLGTFDEQRREAAYFALEQAAQREVPWVLDPVFIDRSPPRGVLAQELFAWEPAALRLNAAEFSALTGLAASRDNVGRLAAEKGAIMALTGAIDVVTDGARVFGIDNGHALMTKVTAMGDALSALVAACLAVEPDRCLATASAVLAFGVAGEIAAETALGPGSFAVALIDALHGLGAAELRARGNVT